MAAWASAVVVLLAWSKFRPTGHLVLVAAGIGCCAAVAACTGWASRKPTLLEVARVADARLGLDERLASALCFAGAPGGMQVRLQADAVARAGTRRPAEAFPLRRHSRLAATTGAALLVAAVFVVTPNPQAATLARRAADQAALAQARRVVNAAREELGSSSSAEARKAGAALQEALAELRSARTPLAALVALSGLSRQLAALEKSPSKAQEIAEIADAAAGDALAGAPGAARLSSDLSSGDLVAAAADLRSLAAGLSKLTPGERTALAAALAEAAAAAGYQGPAGAKGASGGAVGSSATLAGALATAGAAMAVDQLGSAGRALGAAANSAAVSASAVSSQQELLAIQAAVQDAQGQVASQAQADSNGGASQATGGPAGPGRQGQGAGQTGGQRAGTAGNPAGPNGAGPASAAGPGGAGGSGSGSGGEGGPLVRGRPLGALANQVFVQGQPGGSEQVVGEQPGKGKSVKTTGYQAVLPSFERTALQGLGSQVVDPDDQGLVRSYFSSLGGGK